MVSHRPLAVTNELMSTARDTPLSPSPSSCPNLLSISDTPAACRHGNDDELVTLADNSMHVVHPEIRQLLRPC